MDKILVVNKGTCVNTAGYGTWEVCAYRNGSKIRITNGSEDYTTTNTMELRAVVESFKLIDTMTTEKTQKVIIYNQTDYVKWSLGSWVPTCVNKGEWTTNSGKPINNTGMWIELLNYLKKYPYISMRNVNECANDDYMAIV